MHVYYIIVNHGVLPLSRSPSRPRSISFLSVLFKAADHEGPLDECGS